MIHGTSKKTKKPGTEGASAQPIRDRKEEGEPLEDHGSAARGRLTTAHSLTET